jgi:hypothetical protein
MRQKRHPAPGVFFVCYLCFDSLDENDLRAFGHIHEVTGGDHAVNAGLEILLPAAEHIYGHLVPARQ